MVFVRTFINLTRQLWKCSNNDSIIVFVDPRKSAAKMDLKYADRLESCEEPNHVRLCNIESCPVSRSAYKRMQSTCYNFLERPNGILSVSYHFALFALVVLGLVLAVLQTMAELKNDNGLKMTTYVLEVFLLIIFISEYILRMWSAGCRSTYSGVLGRVRFAFKPFVIVDIVVIGSALGVIVYSGEEDSSTVSILRFIQVLRMVRFDRQGASWKLLGSVLFLHRQELLTTFYIGFCSLIFASFFVYQAESVENKDEFGTFADSFWWGVVTLTTVGYGDKVPKSWAGRGVAAFFAIMGISFFALPAGILGSGFALKVSQQQRQKHVKRRRRPAAMLIQCNWRYYASMKDSKLNATWSPYIKYLQGKNSKKEEQTSEKPSQPLGRVRKISIFGRKSSAQSSETLHKPTGNGTPEHIRHRNQRKIRSEIFHSNDSLHDGQSYSTADQHTDDEHVGNHHTARKPILVIEPDGTASLPASYKRSISFTRYLKFLVALRKFRLAKKPYDVKDVIEQYSTGHVEVLGKVKSIGNKIDEALGYKVGTEKGYENPSGKTNVINRLSKLEKQVKSLENKLDKVIDLLEDSKRKTTFSKESCSMCNHKYRCEQHTERCCSEGFQNKDNFLSEESKKPTRRRKLGMSNQNLNNDRLSEREELVSNEELRRVSSNCEQNLDQCFGRRYSENSLKIETDGRNYLSPGYSCDGTSNLSRQSSSYGISDNCPSPNPSSSDESYHHSKNDDLPQNMLSDGMVPHYREGYQSKDDTSNDTGQIPISGSSPMYESSFHVPEHGTSVEIPVESSISSDQDLYGDQTSCVQASGFIPPQFGKSNQGYLGTSTGSSGKHISPGHGYTPGNNHASPELSTATLPSLYSDNSTGGDQLSDSRIPVIPYQSPEDFDHSVVMVPPPPSESSQYGDGSSSANQSSDHRIPELYYKDDDCEVLSNNIPDQKERSLSPHGMQYEPEFQERHRTDDEDDKAIQEQRGCEADFPEIASRLSYSCDDDRDSPDSRGFFMGLDSSTHDDHESLQSCDSELSNRNTVDRSDDDVIVITPRMVDIQETRM